MGPLDWARNHPLATAACCVASAAVTAVSAVGIVVWLAFALLGDGGVLFALLGVLLFGGLVLGPPLSVLALAGLGYGVTARFAAAIPHPGTRIARTAEAAERRSPLARLVGLSDLTAPVDGRSERDRVEDRLDRLKAQYVADELSEREFEQRVSTVLAGTDSALDRESFIEARLREARERDSPTGSESGVDHVSHRTTAVDGR